MRCGLVAQKVGMTRVFNDAGEHVPVTVLKVDTAAGCRRPLGREGQVHRRPARLRQGQGEERDPADARSLRQGQGRAEEEAGRVPRRQGRRARGRRRAGAEPLRARPVRRRRRHHDRPRLHRLDGALELPRPRGQPRRVGLAPSATARPATARIPAAPSPARRWPATTATSA